MKIRINAHKAFGKQSIINIDSAIENYGLDRVINNLSYITDGCREDYELLLEKIFSGFIELVCGVKVVTSDSDVFVDEVKLGRVGVSPVVQLYNLMKEMGADDIEAGIPFYPFQNRQSQINNYIKELVSAQTDIERMKSVLLTDIGKVSETKFFSPAITIDQEEQNLVSDEEMGDTPYIDFDQIKIAPLLFDEFFDQLKPERRINSIEQLMALEVMEHEGVKELDDGPFELVYGVFYGIQIGSGRSICIRGDEACLYIRKVDNNVVYKPIPLCNNSDVVTWKLKSPWNDTRFMTTLYGLAVRGISPKFVQVIGDSTARNKSKAAAILTSLNSSGFIELNKE